MSRWWARIHWTWDNENGLRLGRSVGDKVIEWAKADGALKPALWSREEPMSDARLRVNRAEFSGGFRV